METKNLSPEAVRSRAVADGHEERQRALGLEAASRALKAEAKTMTAVIQRDTLEEIAKWLSAKAVAVHGKVDQAIEAAVRSR